MNSDNLANDQIPVDLTGRRIADYEVIRRLGRGGMADVFLAEQQSLKRKVALKVLKSDLAKDHSYIERFHREAQSAAALVQANIVQIYEVGEAEGFHFISQEYVAGRNLRQYLARHGAVEPVMALNVMRQVAFALQKAGEMQVIHRDIKPENIMLATNGEVKVTDFGLARINNDEAKKDLTQIGVTMGTPLYMSPEQVEGKPVDPCSDIYSLGITAYHMLAGEPPFDGETALAIALKHVKESPVSLKELRPDVPDELVDLINKMIAKNPKDRPSSGGQLLKELRKIKVDAEQDWEQLVEKLATTDGIDNPSSITNANLAVTRQLQAVMRGNIQSWWSRPITILALLLLAAAGGFFGSWIATQNATQDPLVEAVLNTPKIPKFGDIRSQFDYASSQMTVEAFEALIEYFPVSSAQRPETTEYYHKLANQRMLEMFLGDTDWNRALHISNIFEKLRPDDEFRIVGVATNAIINDATGKPEEEIIGLLLMIRDSVGMATEDADKQAILRGELLKRLLPLYEKYEIQITKDISSIYY